MKQIIKAEIRENKLILLVFLTIASLGLFLFVFSFNKNIFLMFWAIGITFLGSFFAWRRFILIKKRQFPLSNLLRDEPEKIVWVYSILTQRMPFGFEVNQTGTMYFKLIDGDELTVSLPADQLKSVSRSLNTRLPHATFGYTKEREQWFMAHPAMLLKDEEP